MLMLIQKVEEGEAVVIEGVMTSFGKGSIDHDNKRVLVQVYK